MKKIILITVFLAILVFAILYFSIPDMRTSYEIVELSKKEQGESFKLIIVSRGLNYRVAHLTNQESIDINDTDKSSYVYSSFPLFVEQIKDTIIVYTSKKSLIPEKIKTKSIIKQIELQNREIMSLYDTYKEKNLILID